MVFSRVVIIGVGLIGGSVALAIRQKHPACRIIGVGRLKKEAKAMLARGVVHEATTDLAVIADADLVILATPVGVALDLIGRLPPMRGIVTDVLSTKRSIVEAAEAREIRFVGSHPMAGSDRRGLEHARADLFDGAVCIVTPTDQTDPAAADLVEQFWQSLGLRTLRMTPTAHDRLVARASHVPHVVAAALVEIQSDRTLAVTAGGFRDTTRVANGDPEMWADILIDNRDELANELRNLQQEIEILIDCLDHDDWFRIKAWLASARKTRQSVFPDVE